MTAHIICLTLSGGIPLFSRHKGEGDAMTFSKIASLNGVHMFLKSQNIELLSTDLPDATIVWREFEQCIILIAIASGATKYALYKFLDATFGAMVLYVGIDEIKNTKNIEKLKKDIRACHPVIDTLLECLDVGNKISAKTDITYMTECVISHENHLLQACLEGYMECLDSMYGCVIIHGCLSVATEGWWSLDSIERKLLIVAATVESNCTTLDLPVFLPCKSPNVAFRLVSITLINHVQVLALCGPSPELHDTERFAVQCWKNSIDLLRSSEQSYPRGLSAVISLDNGTLGFLLVNLKFEKFVLGRNSQSTKSRVMGTHRLDILRTFYHQAVETFVVSTVVEERDDDKVTETNKKFTGVKETYLCSEYHKCHALREGEHILCVLYASVIPTHTMRLITQKVLKTLLMDKQICW